MMQVLLSDSQSKSLELWVSGMTLKEIGVAMSISDKTAEYHLNIAKAKIGYCDKAHATKWALANGLTTLELPEPRYRETNLYTKSGQKPLSRYPRPRYSDRHCLPLARAHPGKRS